MNLKWDNFPGQENSLFLGKWKVGGVYYSGLVSKDDPRKYKAYCLLPGIKEVIGHFKTEQEAMQRLERAANWWVKEAGES